MLCDSNRRLSVRVLLCYVDSYYSDMSHSISSKYDILEMIPIPTNRR